ncbi:MAG: hypothetical protein IIB72_01505 [Proteobacteria bacterium]|nr:hypothetical protein [Pseudomonadota bacterium]
MKKLLCIALSCFVYLAVPVAVSAQEEIDASVDKDAARAERRARMEEFRQLSPEERQAQREDRRRRLENLPDDERAALREKRAQQRQSGSRQGQRPRRGNRGSRGSTDNG